MEQFFDEVERGLGAYTRQHASRLRKAIGISRDVVKLGSVEEFVGDGFEDCFKEHIRCEGLTDSQEESRLKGLHALWSYGEEKGYFEGPTRGPVRKNAGRRGPLRVIVGESPRS